MRATIRAFGTDCAVTNTTISYADGRTKETLLNGVVKTAYEYGPNWTKTYEGPAGLDSPRWSCSYEDALGRTIAETRPGFRGALLVTSNEYNTANQLVATRSYAIEQSEQSEQSNNGILSSTLTRLSTFASMANFFRGETPRDWVVCRESSRIASRNAV